jgi:hypothetical protein
MAVPFHVNLTTVPAAAGAVTSSMTSMPTRNIFRMPWNGALSASMVSVRVTSDPATSAVPVVMVLATSSLRKSPGIVHSLEMETWLKKNEPNGNPPSHCCVKMSP